MYGDRLKSLRIKNGYTQQEVAEKIGVTKATISKYETEQRGLNHIEKFADLFGVEPAYILFGKNMEELQEEIRVQTEESTKEEVDYWKSVFLPGRMSELLPLFDKLNDTGQKEAIRRVEELTEVPKYQREKPKDAPTGVKDTTPPESPSDGPQEGK